MKCIQIALILMVVLTSCSRFLNKIDSTPSFNQEPTHPARPNPTPDLKDGSILVEPQKAINAMKALCCNDDWRDHLIAAEIKTQEARSKGVEVDTGAVFLESLEAAGAKFDANEYFTVLTHLEPEDGYALDYVYFAPGGDGAPYIYAKRKGAPALANYKEYQKTNTESYLDHIQADDTAESYYELALLSVMGGQYYLSWHFEYNDWEVVSNKEGMEKIIDQLNEKYTPLSKEKEIAALQLDVAPRVKFESEKALVRILVFTKWGGFLERNYAINRKFPHQMILEEKLIIPYNCGIVF